MNKKLSVHFSALILVAISLSACIGASGKTIGTIAYLKHDYSVWIVNEDGSNPTHSSRVATILTICLFHFHRTALGF